MTLSKKGQGKKYWHNAHWFDVNVPSYNFQVLITKGSKVIYWTFFQLDLEIVNLGQGQIFSCTAPRLSLIYSCSKFQNLISYSSQVMAWTNLDDEEEKKILKKKKIDKNNMFPLWRGDNIIMLFHYITYMVTI